MNGDEGDSRHMMVSAGSASPVVGARYSMRRGYTTVLSHVKSHLRRRACMVVDGMHTTRSVECMKFSRVSAALEYELEPKFESYCMLQMISRSAF